MALSDPCPSTGARNLRAKSEKLGAKSLVLTDKFGRAITDLRISITDRCNYKCVYCRTGNGGALYGDLPFDDYLRMARVLVGMGITKIRLTGGEPLLRKGVVDFVRELAQLRAPNGGGGGETQRQARTPVTAQAGGSGQ